MLGTSSLLPSRFLFNRTRLLCSGMLSQQMSVRNYLSVLDSAKLDGNIRSVIGSVIENSVNALNRESFSIMVHLNGICPLPMTHGNSGKGS